MKSISLGQRNIDLDVLTDTRLLIQANSGGGKSWCIRRILEQSHDHIQQIVIDLEGEFSTLREKHDYILAGKGGDIPTDIRSAALLARRILELNVSAIIDLYELPHYDRKIFVKRFLDAMINAPKELWHPCLVVVDEAHVFCPEKGQSEAMSSVIELCTRGRKRGYCAVLATQRISKLNKDAAAECNNKLIGRTGLDIDMKRAADDLGFTSKEQYLKLRLLDPGEFYAYGPALSPEPTRIMIGKVETTHPRAGARIMIKTPAAPTSKIKTALQRLTDLPKEADEEARTIDDFRRQNIELRRKLTAQENKAPVVNNKGVVVNAVVNKAEIDRRVKEEVDRHVRAFASVENAYKNKINEWRVVLLRLQRIVGKFFEDAQVVRMPDDNIGASYLPMKPAKPVHQGTPALPNTRISKTTSDEYSEPGAIGAGERKLLVAIATHEQITRKHLTVLTGYRRSSRDAYIQRLIARNLVVIEGPGAVKAASELFDDK